MQPQQALGGHRHDHGPDRQALIRQMALQAGIVVENHKVDGLRPYGPDHGSLMESSPCHIPKGDKT